MSDTLLDVDGIETCYGLSQVLFCMSLQIKVGEMVALMGRNGMGKTTTIRILCGLLTPDSGEGTCLGYDIRRDADKIKRKVGYMTQRFSLYEDLSIRENLDFIVETVTAEKAKELFTKNHFKLEIIDSKTTDADLKDNT